MSLSIKILIGLIFCNLIWAMHPVMGKWLLEQFAPTEVAEIRYGSALLVYWIYALLWNLPAFRLKPKPRFSTESFFYFPRSWENRLNIFILGFMAFCFSPLTQCLGLARSLASENALIVAVEPVATVGFAWLLLREKVNSRNLIAFGFTILGFLLLAGPNSWLGLGEENTSHFYGNILILLSLLGEVVYSIYGRKMASTYPPVSIFGTALTIGVICLVAIAGFMDGGAIYSKIFQMNLKSFVAMLWIGPIGTAGAYLFYLIALSEVPVSSAVPFIFLQPLAGVFFGFLFLGDQLTVTQLIGGGLILLAILFPHFRYFFPITLVSPKKLE